MKYCPKCGCPCEETETVCMICNTPLAGNTASQKEKRVPASGNGSNRIPTNAARVQVSAQNHRNTQYESTKKRAKLTSKKNRAPVFFGLAIVLTALVAFSLAMFLSKFPKADKTSSSPSGSVAAAHGDSVKGTEAPTSEKPKDSVTVYVAEGYKSVTRNNKTGTSIRLKFYGFMADGKPLWILQDQYIPATSDVSYPSDECRKEYYIYDSWAAKEVSKMFTQNDGSANVDPKVEEILLDTLTSYGVAGEDLSDPKFLGVNASGGVEIEYIGGAFGILRTFDNQNRLMLDERYHNGDVITSIRYQYGSNGILETSKIHSALGNTTIDTEYSKSSDGKTEIQKKYQYEGGQRPSNCQPEEYHVYYDSNGLLEREVSASNSTEYYYQFIKIEVPADQINYVTNIYKSLEIPFVIDTGNVLVNNTF